ncbi:hypothetical protein PENTCL1PPCAC_9467, partial [Pristionchus entomophagus]
KSNIVSAMRPRPPDIPKPTPCGINLGLVDSFRAITRGSYFDVIVQFVFSSLGERNTPMLQVWDGSEWDHDRIPLVVTDLESERSVEIPPDEELREKAKGRMVTIFCYDFETQCKLPIQSGDWLYFENVHCAYGSARNGTESRYSSLVMHDNARRRSIWRLEQPILPTFFYERQWKAAIARTEAAQPLPPPRIAVVEQHQPVFAAAAAVATPRLTALDQLMRLVLDKMLTRGVRMPTTLEALERVAEQVVAAMAAATAAGAAAPVADPPAPAAAAAAPQAQQPPIVAAAAVAPAASAAATPAVQPAPPVSPGRGAAAPQPQPHRSPRSPRKAAAAAVSPIVTRAATAAAAAAVEAAVSPPAGTLKTRKRSAAIKQEEPSEGGAEQRESPKKRRRSVIEVVVIDSESEGEDEQGGWVKRRRSGESTAAAAPAATATAAAPAATATAAAPAATATAEKNRPTSS